MKVKVACMKNPMETTGSHDKYSIPQFGGLRCVKVHRIVAIAIKRAPGDMGVDGGLWIDDRWKKSQRCFREPLW
jgi:hypothetical protein